MIMESYISLQKGLLTAMEYLQIKNLITGIFEPFTIDENDIELIQNLLTHDKKNEYGKVQFALIDGIGKIIINQSVENELIVKAFEDYKN